MSQEILLVLAALFVVGGVAALALFSFFSRSKSASEQIQERLDAFSRTFLEELRETTKLMNERLKENMEFAQRTQNATHQAVNTVTQRLVQLEESSQRIFELGKDLTSLQDILRAPKLRGILGEYFLGDLLSQILPKEHYSLQYSFKNGEKVDAVIHLKELAIPIDAKFPLENFRKMIEAQETEQKTAFLKAFLSDARKHVDAVAKKYILPDQGTSDFALLYIPAENVYYELFVQDRENRGLAEHAFSKRVIPVSPNSFYAYLQAILIGLRGMQIEKSAKDILIHLSQLRGDFTNFAERFRILGNHIRDAEKSYDESERQLDRIGEQIARLESPGKPPLLEK